MKAIIVGGFGRSGTSLIRNWLIDQPGIVSFGPTEAKFFVEPYGLVDLHRAYVSDYSFSRATIATSEFLSLMTDHLVDPDFTGQPSLIATIPADRRPLYFEAVHRFVAGLSEHGVPVWQGEAAFHNKTRTFVGELVELLAARDPRDLVFVEKTPHNALNPGMFVHLFDPAKLVWIIRDPRAVTYSTAKMDWGPAGLDAAMTYVQQVIRRYLAMRHRYGGYEIRLEQLETEHDAVVAGLSDYCGIPVLAEREAFQADIIHDWRNYLHGEKLDRVTHFLAEEIAALGYR